MPSSPAQPNKSAPKKAATKKTSSKGAARSAAKKKSAATPRAKKTSAKKTGTKKTNAKKTGTKKTGVAGSTPTSQRTSTPVEETTDAEPAASADTEGTHDGLGAFEGFGGDNWALPFGFGGPPPDLADVGEFIRSQRELAKLSVRRLAELANVSNPYLSQVERGLRKPSADILQQLASALRISVESLYVKAGILPDDPDRSVSSVAEAIEHDPYLSDEQKVALRGVYDSFVNRSS